MRVDNVDKCRHNESMTNGLFRVVTDDGAFAGMIKPCVTGISAFGLKGQNLGQFATLSEAIAAVHANVAWWTA